MNRITILTMLAVLCSSWAHAQSPGSSPGSSAASPATTTDTELSETAYLLGPEDVLGVFVWREPDLSTSVMVRPDGRISLPLVDDLQAAGKSPEQVRDLIADALSRYIDNPVVSVFVEEINHAKVSVLGEVRLPGRYLMRQKLTLLDAIALAGGFTEFSKRNVAIVRTGPDGVQRLKVDLDGILDGEADWLPELRANDAIYVR